MHKTNKQIPILTSFEVEHLNFNRFRMGTADDINADDINLKIDRKIQVRAGKIDKKKFAIDITINGMVVHDGNKDLKDLIPEYTLISLSHFTSNEDISDFSNKNDIIYLSIIQAFVLTSNLFKKILLEVGMTNDFIPIGIDFDL